MSEETAYPLSWPLNQKRHPNRERARFRRGHQPLSIADAVLDRLNPELGRLGVNLDYVVISTNVKPVLAGTRPRTGEPEPRDPGVAVYFTFAKKKTVLACDIWDRVADNIASIAGHIELRTIERYGVGTLEQAFRGYQQLEDFSAGVPWRRVMGFKDDEVLTIETIEAKYRLMAKEYHPDLTGGDAVQMSQLTEAIAAARKELNHG